ncbi:MAG TPA: glycosyltransferase [Paludibacter sp.]|nr:glycosyltransferase [Paludibacter sp.]
MKIAITTVGSRGDLQPFISLGLGLKNAGYEVLIISAKNEENFVRNYGLGFHALDVDIQELMEGNSDVQKMTKGNNPLKFIITHIKGSKNLKKIMVKTQGEIWNACQNADLIIYHPGMPIGFFIAQVCDKKSVLLNPFPVVATKDYPSILFYTFPRFGKAFNTFTHIIFYKVFWALAKSAIREFWNENIKKEVDFSVSPIIQHIKSDQPVINAYSPLIFKPAREWSENVQTVGSLTIDNESNFTPAKELVDFIKNGEPPIFIGFGSMKDIQSFTKTFEIIAEAVSKTKQRAVIGLGWTKNNFSGLIPDHLFLIENVPFTWLFPQMKLVIHHGGAGTTAAGLTAGKPSIIIPHMADQPAWGQRIYELGVGSKPISKKNLSVDNLSQAILFALQPNIVGAANQLGQLMRMENGNEKAINIIHKYMTVN